VYWSYFHDWRKSPRLTNANSDTSLNGLSIGRILEEYWIYKTLMHHWFDILFYQSPLRHVEIGRPPLYGTEMFCSFFVCRKPYWLKILHFSYDVVNYQLVHSQPNFASSYRRVIGVGRYKTGIYLVPDRDQTRQNTIRMYFGHDYSIWVIIGQSEVGVDEFPCTCTFGNWRNMMDAHSPFSLCVCFERFDVYWTQIFNHTSAKTTNSMFRSHSIAKGYPGRLSTE
jgi:hypothetical protein